MWNASSGLISSREPLPRSECRNVDGCTVTSPAISCDDITRGIAPNMSKSEKKLQAMRTNPVADWLISDVEAVAKTYGVTVRKPSGGSHYTLSHPQIHRILTIPARRPIKAPYIRDFVEFIDEIDV